MFIATESQIENRLVKKVKELGGICYKFTSPGNVGVSDRIVLLPGEKIYFVETKSPGKDLRKVQKYQKSRVEKLGFKYFKLDSYEDVDRFIKMIDLEVIT